MHQHLHIACTPAPQVMRREVRLHLRLRQDRLHKSLPHAVVEAQLAVHGPQAGDRPGVFYVAARRFGRDHFQHRALASSAPADLGSRDCMA